jgi:DMSO/TMAO reductase YedYZ heme-binding membrane subunit
MMGHIIVLVEQVEVEKAVHMILEPMDKMVWQILAVVVVHIMVILRVVTVVVLDLSSSHTQPK